MWQKSLVTHDDTLPVIQQKAYCKWKMYCSRLRLQVLSFVVRRLSNIFLLLNHLRLLKHLKHMLSFLDSKYTSTHVHVEKPPQPPGVSSILPF